MTNAFAEGAVMYRMVEDGKTRCIRRFRAAVYAVCGGIADVDRAFDRLILLMLSEKREAYFWGVMLDHSPSPLFRAFGDREIETRLKERFERICYEYPQC